MDTKTTTEEAVSKIYALAQAGANGTDSEVEQAIVKIAAIVSEATGKPVPEQWAMPDAIAEKTKTTDVDDFAKAEKFREAFVRLCETKQAFMLDALRSENGIGSPAKKKEFIAAAIECVDAYREASAAQIGSGNAVAIYFDRRS
jgi:hypothetical protein